MSVPSSPRTTVTGSGSALVIRSPIGIESAAASALSVSSVGLPRPPSSALSVAFATPDARARSDSDSVRSARRRLRLSPTTLTISFGIANMDANGTNDVRGGRPARLALGGGRRRLRADLRRAGAPGRLHVGGGRRVPDPALGGLGAVRGGVDRRRRRHGARRDRRRAAAQRALPADRAVGRALP